MRISSLMMLRRRSRRQVAPTSTAPRALVRVSGIASSAAIASWVLSKPSSLEKTDSSATHAGFSCLVLSSLQPSLAQVTRTSFAQVVDGDPGIGGESDNDGQREQQHV